MSDSTRAAYTVTAEARQGLALGGPAEVGNDKASLHYVPGSVLRGALAAAWIREYGPPTRGNPDRDAFIGIFERDIRFGSLFAQGSSLTPLSALWCKYPTDDRCRDWSWDAAADGDMSQCPHCGRAAVAGKGEVSGVVPVRVVRTRLDESTGRAMDQTLRARHELPRGQVFRGRIAGWHEWLGQQREAHLGGQRSVNGHTRLSFSPQTGGFTVRAAVSPDTLIVRLLSPAILVDDAGRPAIALREEICRVLGLSADTDLDRLRTREWSRPVKVGGWHAASGLPKPTEYALSMGSTLRLVLRPGVAVDSDRLSALADEGIGLRRVEGFGEVELNPAAWRKPAVTDRQVTDRDRTDPLAALRESELLAKPDTVGWLLSRARYVLTERGRRPGFTFEDLMTERVPHFFTDAQADAVRALFSSPDLGGMLALIEHEFDRLRAAAGSDGAE